MTRKPTFGDKAAYITLLVAEKTLGLLPVAAVWHIGAALGKACHRLAEKRRRIVLHNLSLAKPELSELDRESLAKDVFRYSFANLLSSLKTGSMPIEKLKKHVHVEGIDILEKLPTDKGCIFMICHMGNWEILTKMHKLTPLNKPAGAMFQTLKNPYVDKHVRDGREKDGAKLFAKRRGLSDAAKFLKNGGALGILSDQYAGKKGIQLSLFGEQTFISPLSASMAQKYECPVIPVILTTERAGYWKVDLGAPIYISKELKKEDAVASLIPPMEAIMSEHAKDIFWLHNRWKI